MEVKKVPPRFELGLLDSESNVLTTRPWDHLFLFLTRFNILQCKLKLKRRHETTSFFLQSRSKNTEYEKHQNYAFLYFHKLLTRTFKKKKQE